MANFNPYDAPKAEIVRDALAREGEEGRGVWRDGDTLVMVKIANLPLRCVKCDEPTQRRLKRNVYWHNRWLYILAISPVIYIIVAAIVQKKAKIQVPICDRHRGKRTLAIWTAWLIIFAGLGLMIFGANLERGYSTPVVLFGLFTMFGGAIYGVVRAAPVSPKKIDDTHVWLKGVCPAYLEKLPALP